MKKGTKTALICGVIFLAALVGYTGLDPFSYRNDSFYTGKQMKLGSQPEQVTPESLRERGAVCVQYDGHIHEIEGEFVPFRIHGKKGAYRAAMACADLLDLNEQTELRIPDSFHFNNITSFIGGFHLYMFFQYYHGIPIADTLVSVEAGRFGKPLGITADLHYDFPDDLPTEPEITADEAERIAAKYEMNEPIGQKPDLMFVFDSEEQPALAWITYIGDYGYTVPVNAITGEVIDTYADITEEEQSPVTETAVTQTDITTAQGALS